MEPLLPQIDLAVSCGCAFDLVQFRNKVAMCSVAPPHPIQMFVNDAYCCPQRWARGSSCFRGCCNPVLYILVNIIMEKECLFGFIRFGFDKLSRACRFVYSPPVRAHPVVIDAFTGHLC
jgi:hypothetical protein